MFTKGTVSKVINVYGPCPHGIGSCIQVLEEYSLLEWKSEKTVETWENPSSNIC